MTDGRLRHGHAKRGKRHPLYGVWQAMLNRCCNHNQKAFKDYGWRGIVVCCERVDSFEMFVSAPKEARALQGGEMTKLKCTPISNDQAVALVLSCVWCNGCWEHRRINESGICPECGEKLPTRDANGNMVQPE